MAPRDAASAHIKILFYRWYSFSCNSYCTYLQTLFHSTILFILQTHTSSIHTPHIHPCRRHLGMYLSNIVFTSPTVPKHTIYSSLEISTALHPYRLHLHILFIPANTYWIYFFTKQNPYCPYCVYPCPRPLLSLTYAVFIITATLTSFLNSAPIHPF